MCRGWEGKSEIPKFTHAAGSPHPYLYYENHHGRSMTGIRPVTNKETIRVGGKKFRFIVSIQII